MFTYIRIPRLMLLALLDLLDKNPGEGNKAVSIHLAGLDFSPADEYVDIELWILAELIAFTYIPSEKVRIYMKAALKQDHLAVNAIKRLFQYEAKGIILGFTLNADGKEITGQAWLPNGAISLPKDLKSLIRWIGAPANHEKRDEILTPSLEQYFES